MGWQNLQNANELSTIVEASHTRPQLIFKHSTRCGISAAAKRRLEDAFDDLGQHVDLHYLDLLNHRDISNEIERRFSVYHQSPQILLIRDGASVLDLSHYAIEPARIVDSIVAA